MRTRALVVLAAMLIIAACTNTGASSSPSSAASQPAGSVAPSAPASTTPSAAPLKIGMVTDIGQLEDKSFNEYSWKGVQDGAAAIGAPAPQNIITADTADYKKNIQTFVDDGYNVIVTVGFLIGTDTRAAAIVNPDIQFFGVDQFVADPAPSNYQGILFAEAQPGYLAGIVAASLSKSAVIGAVGGRSDVPPVYKYINGYRNGAASVNPKIKVLVNYTEDFNAPAKGEAAAKAMIGQKADFIFQVAGLTGAGALRAACAAKIRGIGVDVDQSKSLPDAAACIVTSAEKKLQSAVKQALERYKTGPQGGNFFNDAKNDGVGLSPFTNVTIDPAVQAKIDAALAGFKDGSRDPCKPIACDGIHTTP
ncbi:MAG: BMP family ABC transporter substrate-binding protein [Chloroflexota bacterium]|nr:BMP family ABC transporter substrate-binding protein [Chloroflexota bacterium]